MIIDFHKNCKKGLNRLTSNQKVKIRKALELFENNPHDLQLRNHALHGEDQGNRAISAGGDIRLVFREMNDYEVVQFLRDGSHNQVY